MAESFETQIMKGRLLRGREQFFVEPELMARIEGKPVPDDFTEKTPKGRVRNYLELDAIIRVVNLEKARLGRAAEEINKNKPSDSSEDYNDILSTLEGSLGETVKERLKAIEYFSMVDKMQKVPPDKYSPISKRLLFRDQLAGLDFEPFVKEQKELAARFATLRETKSASEPEQVEREKQIGKMLSQNGTLENIIRNRMSLLDEKERELRSKLERKTEGEKAALGIIDQLKDQDPGAKIFQMYKSLEKSNEEVKKAATGLEQIQARKDLPTQKRELMLSSQRIRYNEVADKRLVLLKNLLGLFKAEGVK